jgi:hypothetical protein
VAGQLSVRDSGTKDYKFQSVKVTYILIEINIIISDFGKVFK